MSASEAAHVQRQPTLSTLKNITFDAVKRSLTKNGGATIGWDAVAASSDCIESMQSLRRGISCKILPSQQSQRFVIGLVSAPNAQHESVVAEGNCMSCTYGAYIYNGGLYIQEKETRLSKHVSDVQVKAGTLIEISMSSKLPLMMEYKVDGKVIHPPSLVQESAFPLFLRVVACYHSPLVEALQWIVRPDPSPVHLEGEIELQDASERIHRDPYTKALLKNPSLPDTIFNAIAVSSASIEDVNVGSERVGVSFEVSEGDDHSDRIFAVGFQSMRSSQQQLQNPMFQSLTYAVCIHGKDLRIYEEGECKCFFERVRPHDAVDIEMKLNSKTPVIECRVNGQKLPYIRQSHVPFPAKVKVCAQSSGRFLEGLRWILRKQERTEEMPDPAPSSCRTEEEPAGQPGAHEEPTAETDAPHAGVEEANTTNLQAQVDELLAVNAQQKLQMKAWNEALVSVTIEKGELQAQLHAAAKASRAVDVEKEDLLKCVTELRQEIDDLSSVATENAKLQEQLTSEKAASLMAANKKRELQTRAAELEGEIEEFRKLMREMAKDKVRLQANETELEEKIADLRRRLLPDGGASVYSVDVDDESMKGSAGSMGSRMA